MQGRTGVSDLPELLTFRLGRFLGSCVAPLGHVCSRADPSPAWLHHMTWGPWPLERSPASGEGLRGPVWGWGHVACTWLLLLYHFCCQSQALSKEIMAL